MRAVEISAPGGPEVLQLRDTPKPAPKPNEIVVKVTAAGVNRPDVLQRMGRYPVPAGASPLPGLEIAGEVVEAGASAKVWKPGDKVCALVNGGGYAEFCAGPETQALPVPGNLTLVQAASLPETFFTVWSNVYDRGRLAPGESLLVQGGTSGIGVMMWCCCMSSIRRSRIFRSSIPRCSKGWKRRASSTRNLDH